MLKPTDPAALAQLKHQDIPQGTEVYHASLSPQQEEVRRLIGVILNGGDTPSFAASMTEYVLASGDRVTAACHKAYRKVNQDCVAINIDDSAVTDIDGYGPKGDDVAHRLGSEMLFDDSAKAVYAVHMAVLKDSLYDYVGGACYAHVRIVRDPVTGEKMLEPSQAGDVRILVLDAQGEIVWQSDDENRASEFCREGKISEDQVLYHQERNVVTNSIGDRFAITSRPAVPLKPGYRVILGSDGIFDNLTTEEFLRDTASLNAQDIIRKMESVVYTRMQDRKKIAKETGKRSEALFYTDTYLSEPKADNLSLVVIDISA